MAKDCLGLEVSFVLAMLLLSCDVKADDYGLEEAGVDAWNALMENNWKPGYIGDLKTSLPMRDLPCEGPGTTLETLPGLTWAEVKAMLHSRKESKVDSRELTMIVSNIQKAESDHCCLGIVTTSAYLLPITMPKPRNMARVLSTELNFLLLNITFFETLYSGFPVFGVYDDLSTLEFRTWFHSQEFLEYFEALPATSSCHVSTARNLQVELGKMRQLEHDQRGQTEATEVKVLSEGKIPELRSFPLRASQFRPLMRLAVEVFDSAAAQCRPAAAAAALVLAAAKIQAWSNFKANLA